MSTIRTNPTAPIAMPTLAPVLRPLKSLEAIIPAVFVLLAGDDGAVEVEVCASARLEPDCIWGPVVNVDAKLLLAIDIGARKAVEGCKRVDVLIQTMST